ncbi:MAG: choice-of-anchor V domain-containing protein, partial [Polyangiales bacterium]
MRAVSRIFVAARLFALLTVLLVASRAGASASGVDASWWSNNDALGGCNKSFCHVYTTVPATTASFLSGGSTVTTIYVSPGSLNTLTFRVANSAAVKAGFNVRVNSSTLQSALGTSGSDTNVQTKPNGINTTWTEVTHKAPRAMSGGFADFIFTFTAPNTNNLCLNSYSLIGWGNAVDGSGGTTGTANGDRADMATLNIVIKCTQGNSCGANTGSYCTTGSCTDSYCCSSACTGTCQGCSLATGASANGTCTTYSSGTASSCSPYVCGGGVNCPSTCSSDSNCASGYYCSGTSCVLKKTNGNACTGANQCSSGFCADGFCCNQACTSGCQTCALSEGASANGTCTTLASGSAGNPSCTPYLCAGSTSCPTTCSGDGNCISGDYCNGTTCTAKLAQGSVCTTSNQCSSSNCVDGYCCNTTCNGACDACSVAAGASVNGTCKTVASGSTGSPSCSPYVCNGASTSCPGSCSSDANCISGDYCNGSSCTAKLAQGSV